MSFGGSTRPSIYLLAAAAAFGLAGCGGCGDDDAGSPDARDVEDPDAEPDLPVDADPGDTDPPTSSASPEGDTYFSVPQVIITADEPSTIYYTVDGTTPSTSSPSGPSPLVVTGVAAGTALQFFAVDTAGNAETPVHSELYAIDNTATLTVSLANQTVTVNGLPSTAQLTGTVAYDDAADSAAVTLTYTNMSTRLLFHLKTLYAVPNQGTVEADGTLDAVPFTHFGPAAFDAAAVRAAQPFTIAGIDGTVDPITIDVTFRTDPSWIVSANWDNGPGIVDSSNSGMAREGNSEPFGFRGEVGDNHVQSLAVSPDGRLIYMGMRNKPSIVIKDATTLEAVIGADLDDGTGIGGVMWLQLSPDAQTLYALMLYGDHPYLGRPSGAGAGCLGTAGDPACAFTPPDLVLVKLRRSDLMELDRVALVTDAAVQETRSPMFAMSADGTRAAVPIRPAGSVVLVDLAAMSIVQTIDVSAHFDDPHGVAFSASGDRLFVSERSGTAGLLSIDTISYAITEEVPTTAAVNHTTAGELERGPDGKIYMLRNMGPELAVYDPVGDSWHEVDLPNGPTAIAFPDADHYAWIKATVFGVRQRSDDAIVDLNPDVADQLPWSNFGHNFVIGPP
jgi:hypothetical protein